jgi:predicted nucleotidyltransferase
MKDWIGRDIQEAQVDLVAAYLFGSAIHPRALARDVDVVLVASGNAGEPPWQRAIAYRDALKARFDAVFQLPLSAMVVTLSEWGELDGVVVRDRMSIL